MALYLVTSIKSGGGCFGPEDVEVGYYTEADSADKARAEIERDYGGEIVSVVETDADQYEQDQIDAGYAPRSWRGR